MKLNRAYYSKGSGAVFVFATLIFIVCFYDSLFSLYNSYATSDFGKTHFIVGYTPENTHDKEQSPAVGLSNSFVCGRVLFSPDDNVKQELLQLIEQERKSIKIAIFTFTDKDVAQALLDAHNRGVVVEIVADAGYLRDSYSKIAWLQQHKIPVFTYNPHYRAAKNNKAEMMSIMHHKFVVFGANKDHKPLVWTGSFNFTRAAHLRNQENVIILADESVVKRYTHQFNRLKRRCDDCYENSAAVA